MQYKHIPKLITQSKHLEDANTLSCIAPASGVIIASASLINSPRPTFYSLDSGASKYTMRNVKVFAPIEPYQTRSPGIIVSKFIRDNGPITGLITFLK